MFYIFQGSEFWEVFKSKNIFLSCSLMDTGSFSPYSAFIGTVRFHYHAPLYSISFHRKINCCVIKRV